MANSGTIQLNVTSQGGAITGWIEWTESNVDAAANTSRVTARLIYRNDSAWTTYSDQSTFYLTVNGSTVRNSGGGTVSAGGGTLTALTHTVTVAHGADGTKSVAVSGGGALTGTVGLSASSGSGTAVLTAIPRATQPGLPSAADMGTEITVSLPRAADSFTHRLFYRLNGGSWTEISGTWGASCAWTVPMSLCQALPSAASGTLTVRADTYNGGDLIGTASADMTARVPASVKPAASLTVSPVSDNAVVSGWGVAVQGYTRLSYAVAADVTGDAGASAAGYEFTAGGETLTGQTGATALLGTAGTLTARGRVRDSRGRWSEWAEQTVTVYDYNVPVIVQGRVFRCGSDGAADDAGAYLNALCRGSWADVGGRNTASVRLRWRRSGGTWGNYTALTDGQEAVVNAALAADASYEAELSVTDGLGESRTVIFRIPTAAVAFHLKAGGLAAAFGKYAEHQRELELAESWDLRYKGKVLRDYVFPVGSVYLTAGNGDPALLFGGTWTAESTGVLLGGPSVTVWRRTA